MASRVFSSITVAVIAIFYCADSFSAGPPPVSHPWACADSYCVEVIPPSPYFPYQIETTTELEGHRSSLIVKLRNGGAVAFRSSMVERQKGGSKPFVPTWTYAEKISTASACLTCAEPNRRQDVVLGIAVAGLPLVLSKHLSNSMDVCYWPLDMASAGYGSGRSMALGDKVCVDDIKSAEIRRAAEES